MKPGTICYLVVTTHYVPFELAIWEMKVLGVKEVASKPNRYLLEHVSPIASNPTYSASDEYVGLCGTAIRKFADSKSLFSTREQAVAFYNKQLKDTAEEMAEELTRLLRCQVGIQTEIDRIAPMATWTPLEMKDLK